MMEGPSFAVMSKVPSCTNKQGGSARNGSFIPAELHVLSQ